MRFSLARPSSRVLSVQRSRENLTIASGALDAPGIGGRLAIVLVISDDEVGNVEDQIAGAAIANRKLVAGAEPIEHREARAIKRDVQPLRGLAAVRMGDEQIAPSVLCEILEIFEVADQHF